MVVVACYVFANIMISSSASQANLIQSNLIGPKEATARPLSCLPKFGQLLCCAGMCVDKFRFVCSFRLNLEAKNRHKNRTVYR